ncbi:transposase, partial [Bacillus altitudinis]
FILGSLVTGGNVHDSRMLDSLVSKVTKKVGKPNVVAVDAGYKTPYIAKFLMDQEIRPVMPYTRPRTKAGYLKKN